MSEPTHQITFAELKDALNEMEHVLVSSSQTIKGKTVVKRIAATASGGLIVRNGTLIVYEGIQPYEAMEAYNGL